MTAVTRSSRSPSPQARSHEPLRGQLRIALHFGVTKEEIVELFIRLVSYAGAVRAVDSYQIALAVFAEAS
jgi:4-carboxymuconolactone decarboxylase